MENFSEAAEQRSEAIEFFYEAYELQKRGDYSQALNMYQRSLELYPSAQAYTFMGWTYSNMGNLQKAIKCCLRAIEVDPDFGNPYNDIGAYLIDLGRPLEAVPWLRKATRAVRYDCYHYAWYNLGRVYESLLQGDKAKDAYARALRLRNDYSLALKALLRILALHN